MKYKQNSINNSGNLKIIADKKRTKEIDSKAK